jgi:Protein of unknown function (DUF559)
MVSHEQLRGLGYGQGAIEYAVRSARLHPRFRAVYSVGHAVVGPKGRLWAALLACGPHAVISHRDAAALWNVRRNSRVPVDVTVPGRRRHSRTGLDVHSVRRLDSRDVTQLGGIPVTTLARTLLDLAEVVPQHQLERAVEQAERLQLLDLNAVRDQLCRGAGRRGLKPLTAALTDAVIEPMTRSELEIAFLQICNDFGIPPPIVNARAAGYEVDMLWPRERVVVELDSRAYHLNRPAFERDRQKDAALQLAGCRVIRVTEQQLKRPDRVARTVQELLRLKSAPNLPTTVT